MTIEDNMMICHTKGYKGLKISLNSAMRSYFRERLAELHMGLENRLRDNVALLSGGQRQALALLMAVMSKPAILLLDEHTAALDPSNAALVMDLTRSFTAAGSLTVMMVTHNMSFALETGNRLLMMDAGTIILDVEGEEKSRLTTADLVARFRALKNNDEMMLQ
jgi:putative ABC transport system ATP-binding protein